MSTLCGPMEHTAHGILQAGILEWVAFPSPGDIPNPGIEPRSPALQVDSLPSGPPGKPQITGVGNLSLLQHTFLTQKSNQGLLHCRQILYQLGYRGSPAYPLHCVFSCFDIAVLLFILLYPRKHLFYLSHQTHPPCPGPSSRTQPFGS